MSKTGDFILALEDSGLLENSELVITCPSHGEQPWRGHIVCSHCGGVFDSNYIVKASPGEECSFCGCVLMPVFWDKQRKFSAKAICEVCYYEEQNDTKMYDTLLYGDEHYNGE